jgi:hypothetical protein
MNEMVVDPVDPTKDKTISCRQCGVRTTVNRGRRAHTHLKVIHKVCDRETTSDDRGREQRMLQLRHLAWPVLILDDILLRLVDGRTEMENLVEAVPTWLDLQRVRKEDEDRDGKLSDGNKERGRRVHCDDVCADLVGGTSVGKELDPCLIAGLTRDPNVR